MAQNYTFDEIRAKVIANGSKASKIDWLRNEAGFNATDAENTYRIIMLTTPRPAATRRERRQARENLIRFTMGLELECINVNRYEVRRLCNERGITTRDDYNHYNHDDSRDTYKLMSDSSLHGGARDAYLPCEIVTPVLNDLSGVKTVCEVLNEAGAKVNVSCGLHVHFGASNFTDEQWFRIVCNYARIEGIIDSFMPESRRGDNSQWCRTIKGHGANLERKKGLGYNITRRDCQYELDSRYHKVNLEAFARHKTIEFRQHTGTINYTKIENWVNFLASFLTYSIRHEELIEANSIDTLPFLTDRQKAYFKNRANTLA